MIAIVCTLGGLVVIGTLFELCGIGGGADRTPPTEKTRAPLQINSDVAEKKPLITSYGSSDSFTASNGGNTREYTHTHTYTHSVLRMPICSVASCCP